MSEVETSTALVSLVLAAGVSARELALAADIDQAWLEEPHLIPYAEGLRLWQAAETITGDPAVGLHAGAACTPDRVPMLGTLFGHSDCLRDALERLVRILPTVIRNVPVALESDEDGAAFEYTSPSTARHGVDAMFAGILAIARASAGHPIIPRAVCFQSPRPREPREYVRVFRRMPEWGKARSSLVFAREDLARPFRGAAPPLARVLERHMPHLLRTEQRVERGIEAAVCEAVDRCLDRGVSPTLSEVAAQIGRSGRTIQRELAGVGSTFRAARDRALRARARTLIVTTEEPIASVASRLGFASRTSFERAYRRWWGQTPAWARKAADQS